MKKFSGFLLSFFVLTAVFSGAQAASNVDSNRLTHRGGFYVSGFGDPIGLVGFNLGYHPTDFARVVGGVAYTPAMGAIKQNLLSFGAGLKLMVPTWSFTPVMGTNVSYLMVGGASGLLSYENIGLEYTASNGFHIGAGVNGLYVVAGTTDAVDQVLPYLNIGVFF